MTCRLPMVFMLTVSGLQSAQRQTPPHSPSQERLFRLVASYSREKVQQIIQQSVDAVVDRKGRTLLMAAIMREPFDETVFTWILRHTRAIDAIDHMGATALARAVFCGNYGAVVALLARKVWVDRDALMLAAWGVQQHPCDLLRVFIAADLAARVEGRKLPAIPPHPFYTTSH